MDHFVEKFYTTCCSHDDIGDKSRHIVRHHARAVVDQHVRPFFTMSHPSLEARPKAKYLNPAHDDDHYNDQPWKQQIDGYTSLDILEWLISTCHQEELSVILPVIIPPMLLVIDDFNVEYKARGVNLLSTVVQQLGDTVRLQHGIEDVFIDVLLKCLSYVSEERDLPLLSATYPCLLPLIAKTKKPGSKERAELYTRVLVDGVIVGMSYAGHKLPFLRVLVPPIGPLYREIGSLGVCHLKVITHTLCSVLQLQLTSSIMMEIHLAALSSLDAIIEICWPRIPHYQGCILATLSKCWMFYHTNTISPASQLRSSVSKGLQHTFKLLQTTCGPDIKNDVNALLAHNASVFSDLVT